MKLSTTMLTATLATTLIASSALGAGHAAAPSVMASDQSVADGVVSAEVVTAAENGWMVVHRTDASMAPGVVVGHAPLREGENVDVIAILTEAVAPGDMLMVHGEAAGVATGIFEYTLGAIEDGPIRIDGNLVMAVVTAQ